MFTLDEIIKKRREKWEQHHDIEQDKIYINAVAKHIMQNPQLIKDIQEKPELLIEAVFVIVDKERNTVPFFLNELQREFLDYINQAKKDYKEGKRLHLKFMLLKGRQGGFTTVITAYELVCAITQRNFAGFTLADISDNTESIFNSKAKFVFDKLPECLKPSAKYNSKREFYFDKINSSWEVATQGNKEVGRSKTLNFFHGSEAAFWDNLESVMTGLGEALTKDSIQILETTANGYNQYKDMWDADNNFENLFFVWWKTAEYRLNFESESREQWFKDKVLNSKEPKEVDYKSESWIFYKCSILYNIEHIEWEQIYWYYNKWKDKKEKLLQEYPCSPDEAFLASGLCVFNKEKLIVHKKLLTEKYKDNPPKQGYFQIQWNNPDAMDYIKSFKWVDSLAGCIKIYEESKEFYPYVIGGDTKGEGSDKFAGTVINNTSGRRAAHLHGEMKSKYYTAQMYCLGLYYNTALISIETNFNTYPIELLVEWKYPNQYLREKKDTFTGDIKKSWGWKTDGNTRPLIIEKEVTMIDEHIENVVDIEFINECLTFVIDENGRPDAETGKHDDLLFSDMIANECRSQQKYLPSEQFKPKAPEPWQLQSEKKSDYKNGGFSWN